MEAIIEQPAIRSEILVIRATASQVSLLKKAALVRHKTLTEYILDTACRDAEETLLEQSVFFVDQTLGKRFMDLLDEPACETEGLKRLRDGASPWD